MPVGADSVALCHSLYTSICTSICTALYTALRATAAFTAPTAVWAVTLVPAFSVAWAAVLPRLPWLSWLPWHILAYSVVAVQSQCGICLQRDRFALGLKVLARALSLS